MKFITNWLNIKYQKKYWTHFTLNCPTSRDFRSNQNIWRIVKKYTGSSNLFVLRSLQIPSIDIAFIKNGPWKARVIIESRYYSQFILLSYF